MVFKKSVIKKEPALIYIGPTLPGGRLQSFTVYKQFPHFLDNVIAKIPDLPRLFIPTTDFTEKLKERDTKGTPLYIYNARVTEVIKNGL